MARAKTLNELAANRVRTTPGAIGYRYDTAGPGYFDANACKLIARALRARIADEETVSAKIALRQLAKEFDGVWRPGVADPDA